MEVVAELDKPPGNVAVTPEGRIFISMHPFGNPEYGVAEVHAGGTLKPYPEDCWSRPPGPDGMGLAMVIGLRSDANGILWLLDAGSKDVVPKLVAWDTRRDELHRIIHLPYPTTLPNSFHQDLALDPLHDAIYLADMGRADFCGPSTPALVVVDVKTGGSRRVLEDHPSLAPEDLPMVIEGKPVVPLGGDGKACQPRFGLNPITIDTQSEWVYYGAVSGTSLYRVRTADLVNPNLNSQELGQCVERFGDKPISDGITIDTAGNVYVSDLQSDAVGVVGPDGRYRILIQDHERLHWPDGFSYGPDGYLYLTVNQLNRMPLLNGGKDESRPPFLLVRFRPLTTSAIGR